MERLAANKRGFYCRFVRFEELLCRAMTGFVLYRSFAVVVVIISDWEANVFGPFGPFGGTLTYLNLFDRFFIVRGDTQFGSELILFCDVNLMFIKRIFLRK